MRVNGKQIACDQNSNTYQTFSFDLSLIVKNFKNYGMPPEILQMIYSYTSKQKAQHLLLGST